jgi:hypothetical protein
MSMECRRAEELFSDHLEGGLHPILAGELEQHLASCASCRELRAAVAEVVGMLRAAAELEPPADLARRAASAALAPESRPAHSRGLAPRPLPLEIRPAFVLPHWLNAAAAGLALIALGTTLAVVGPERPTRAAQRLVGQTVIVGSSLIERRDRLIEDVRLLGVVLGTAFEGRIDRVGERVNDYRRLLERRKPAPPAESKEGRRTTGGASRVAGGFRTGAASGS